MSGREVKRDELRGMENTVDKRWMEGDQVKMFTQAYLHSYAHIYTHEKVYTQMPIKSTCLRVTE